MKKTADARYLFVMLVFFSVAVLGGCSPCKTIVRYDTANVEFSGTEVNYKSSDGKQLTAKVGKATFSRARLTEAPDEVKVRDISQFEICQLIEKMSPGKARDEAMLKRVNLINDLDRFARQGSETELRFKSFLHSGSPEFFTDGNGGTRMKLRFVLQPTLADNKAQVRLVAGVAQALNDGSLKSDSERNTITFVKCESNKDSCLTSTAWNWSSNPFIIKAGQPDNSDQLVWSTKVCGGADMPSCEGVTRVRVRWRFYQIEADNGNSCAVDSSEHNPDGKMPFLVVQDRNGKTLDDECYYHEGQDEFAVAVR